MTAFSEFELPRFLLDNIETLGWKDATPIQALVIPKALLGYDILGGAPTGTGKSAAFLLPLISALSEEEGHGLTRALILEPSRELAQQVADTADRLMAGTSLTVGAIIGGAGRDEQRAHPFDLVVATPGRLLEFLRKDWLDTSELEFLVIDEADRMLDMGFRDDVSAITDALPNRGQTMLFSATLEGRGIRDFAQELLEDPQEFRVAGEGEGEKLPELLEQRAYYTAGDSQKVQALSMLLTTGHGRKIVFVKTRDRLSRLSHALRRAGIECSTLQGEQSQREREAALKAFVEGGREVLLATDVAARGLDLPEVSTVFNFDMPGNAAIYVHRAGRTARAGARGVAVNFITPEQLEFMEKVERYTSSTMERRAIKNVCAAFPEGEQSKAGKSEKKRKRAAPGGGFDRKTPAGDKKTHKKVRLRDKKNKGKPDFAAKRAKKAARAAALGQSDM